MSTGSKQRQPTIDDAQLRYEGLVDHVRSIQGSIQDFPGAVNLKALAASYLKMIQDLFPIFTAALKEKNSRDPVASKHKMVDKMAKEWENIFQLAANAKLLGDSLDTAEDFSWLDPLVKAAQRDLNLENWDFIVVPRVSVRFALTNFKYAPRFAALDLPVSALNTGWEWSVLWHELAGRTTRDLKSEKASAFNVKSILSLGKSSSDELSESFNDMVVKLQSGEAVGSPLLNRIRKLFKEPRRPRWSADWVEEIFEDSCSVLAFGEDFLPILDNVLSRKEIPEDQRHPSKEIRVRMARRMLGQEVTSGNEEQDRIEMDVVDRIRKNIEARGLDFSEPRDESRRKVRSGVKSLMRKFSDGTVTTEDTRAFKDELRREVAVNDQYRRKGAVSYPVDVRSWKEVASGDPKKMLEIGFSEMDFNDPLASHTADQLNQTFSITIHGQIHDFFHTFFNHK